MASQPQFVDLTLRDGQQSIAATRMTTEQALQVLPMIEAAGYAAIELWGGAVLDACVRYLNEDPWERLDRFHEAVSGAHRIRILCRGQNLFAYQPFSDDLVIAFVKEAIRSGTGIVRVFDALNDWRNLQIPMLAAKAYGGIAEAALSYTTSPVHTTQYFIDLALKAEEEGADQIAIKDMAGLLLPQEALALFPRLKDRINLAAGALSGGEQQMLAMARALMSEPSVIILDEPSLGLAPKVVGEIMAALGILRDTKGLAVLLVEQNVRAAFKVADRVMVMDRGKVVAEGTPADLASDERVRAAYLGGSSTSSSGIAAPTAKPAAASSP